MSALEFDTQKFDKAMTELSKHGNRTASEIVTFNSRDMLRSIVHASPRLTGTMNGGWVKAWEKLELPGLPKNEPRSKYGHAVLAGETKSKTKRTYVQDGSIVDNRRSLTDPSFTMRNNSHYIDSKRGRVNYPHIVAAKTRFMRKAESDVERKFNDKLESKYRRLLGRH